MPMQGREPGSHPWTVCQRTSCISSSVLHSCTLRQVSTSLPVCLCWPSHKSLGTLTYRRRVVKRRLSDTECPP